MDNGTFEVNNMVNNASDRVEKWDHNDIVYNFSEYFTAILEVEYEITLLKNKLKDIKKEFKDQGLNIPIANRVLKDVKFRLQQTDEFNAQYDEIVQAFMGNDDIVNRLIDIEETKKQAAEQYKLDAEERQQRIYSRYENVAAGHAAQLKRDNIMDMDIKLESNTTLLKNFMNDPNQSPEKIASFKEHLRPDLEKYTKLCKERDEYKLKGWPMKKEWLEPVNPWQAMVKWGRIRVAKALGMEFKEEDFNMPEADLGYVHTVEIDGSPWKDVYADSPKLPHELDMYYNDLDWDPNEPGRVKPEDLGLTQEDVQRIREEQGLNKPNPYKGKGYDPTEPGYK